MVSGEVAAVPLDATLGVPGLPQSATGQTTILTGENAAALAGRHVNAHPTPELVAVLERSSIYRRVLAAGKSVTFINAYRDEAFDMMKDGTYPASVSTMAALRAGVKLRTIKDLLEGQAVYHDVTSGILREHGYDVPEVSPEEAGIRAARIALAHDFSMFEFFLTDITGHRGEMQRARRVLERLDAFLGAALGVAAARHPRDLCVIITSDHGNIEDLSTPSHTCNPVPGMFFGAPPGGGLFRIFGLRSICDIAGAVMRLLGVREGAGV